MLTDAAPTFEEASVVITGGLGFIGSNLARRLVCEGAHVTLVDSLVPQYGGNLHNVRDLEDRVKINLSDIRDPFSLGVLLRDVDYIFNLAGQTSHIDSMIDPQTDLAINTAAQLSLLETCRERAPACKIIFASTRQIYGKPDYLPVDESHPIRPVDINGINKWAGESYHRLYADVYGMKTGILRLTNTYGPGMRIRDARQTFLGVWIRRALEGQPIDVYGGGEQLRDFNFVEDVVEAMLCLALQPNLDGVVYNLGGGRVWSLAQVAELIAEIVPGIEVRNIPFPKDRKSIDIGDYYGSIEAVKDQLGWTPRVELEQGLCQTFDFYRGNLSQYVG